MKTQVNYKEIKRNLFKRDTGLDTRFTTKVGKSAKKYNRRKEKSITFLLDTETFL